MKWGKRTSDVHVLNVQLGFRDSACTHTKTDEDGHPTLNVKLLHYKVKANTPCHIIPFWTTSALPGAPAVVASLLLLLLGLTSLLLRVLCLGLVGSQVQQELLVRWHYERRRWWMLRMLDERHVEDDE